MSCKFKYKVHQPKNSVKAACLGLNKETGYFYEEMRKLY